MTRTCSRRTRVARSTLNIGTGLLVAFALACADQPTAPGGESLTGLAAASSANGPSSTALASVGWGAVSRALVVQPPAMGPTTAARAYALLAVGQYGAALAADEGGGRSQYEARRGAIAGASARILTYLFPGAAAALAQRVADEGEMGPGNVHPHFTRGVEIGRAIGDRMVAWGMTDGFTTPWTGTIPVGPGKWTGSPPVAAAQHAFMRPYSLSSPSQFRSPPPPAFGSPEFLADLKEVRDISNNRTPEQLSIAITRNMSTGTITTLGVFNELASGYIAERGLDELAAAHVLAVLNAAGSDAVIGCWDSKLHYFYIRPSQVPLSSGETAITLPIAMPNHPSYPSGHSCLSAAAAEVLTRFFPDHAAELQAHVIQNGLSRIYAGIHYRFDVTAGQALGRAVGAQTLLFDQREGLFSVIP